MAPASSPPICEPPPTPPLITSLPPEATALLSHLLGHPTEPSTRSLYTKLIAYHTAPDAHLDPAPQINRALTTLVAALQGMFTHTQPADTEPMCLRRGGSHACHRFAALQSQLCDVIDASPALQARALVLRSVAQRAESRLELYYVPVLLASDYRPTPGCDKTGGGDRDMSVVDNASALSQHSNGAVHVEKARPLVNVDVDFNPNPDPNLNLSLSLNRNDNVNVGKVAEEDAARVAAAAADFPYIHNYATMVQRESAVVRAFCDRPVRHVVFCGSGPLPLTGLLLGAHLGARVTMVDSDATAVERSRELLAEWGRRGVIDAGSVSVVHADCATLRFTKGMEEGMGGGEAGDCEGGEGEGEGEGRYIACDLLFVAALIPQKVKECVIRRVAEARADGPLVVTRSAHGLTARLAYEESGRGRLGKLLEFVGTVVPRTHELSDGRIVDDDVKPIELFESEILNSLELYRWKAVGEDL